MGLREPFTILRNVRATTSPIAPSVDLVRFPSWRIAYIGLGDEFDGDKVKAYPPGSVIVLPGNTSHFH